ncbi:MAG TPA: ribonuclease P protein component [Vitreimonas sp.]|nr:ribonuclease P protein component [Vitreimonas sp.]
MVPRQYRLQLRQQPDFFNRSQRVFSSLFTLFYVPADRPAVATIVPRKNTQTQVERNTLKRRLAQIWTDLLQADLVNCQVVISLKPAATKVDGATLKSELLKSLAKIKK